MSKSKSKKTPKWKTQMAKLIAFSELTGYPVDVALETALDHFLTDVASAKVGSCSVSATAWNKRARGISEEQIELWTPLWAVLQDGFDEAFGGEPAPEPGDPGSMHAALQGLAEEAGISLMQILRAACYRFRWEHSEQLIADPHNLKYRLPTNEEAEVLHEVCREHPQYLQKPGWCPEDDPLFHEKFGQRMEDAIMGLDAGIQ